MLRSLYGPRTVFGVTWADIFPSMPRAAGLLYTIRMRIHAASHKCHKLEGAAS